MEGATVANIRGAALRLQRQLVLDLGGTVPQLRMAAAEGSALVDTVLSPVSGYDELPEDHAKVFKEYKKEQEKENKAKAQQAARGRGRLLITIMHRNMLTNIDYEYAHRYRSFLRICSRILIRNMYAHGY